jgi:hypothetical protein
MTRSSCAIEIREPVPGRGAFELRRVVWALLRSNGYEGTDQFPGPGRTGEIILSQVIHIDPRRAH